MLRVNKEVPKISPALIERASAVDVPTLGHFLEEGFVSPNIKRVVGNKKICGRVITVRVTNIDTMMAHNIIDQIEEGDILVIDTGGDRAHAMLGGVMGNAIAAKGAQGVIVDGVCTDLQQLRDTGLSVYSAGTSALTQKVQGLPYGSINYPVACGGVPVLPGYIALGDENGLLITDPELVEAVLHLAEKSDADEPELLDSLRAGNSLSETSGAKEALTNLLQKQNDK